MFRQAYTPEHTIAGISREQFDREQAAQLQQAAQQHHVTIGQGPALRARAVELMTTLGTGGGYYELQNAVAAHDIAQGPAAQAAAVIGLRQAIDRWTYDADLALGLQRSNAPAVAAEAARQRAEERSRPVVLTIEQRLARIEKVLGL